MLTLCYIFNKIPLNSPSESVTAGSCAVMSLTSTCNPVCQGCASLHRAQQLVPCRIAVMGTAWQCQAVTRGQGRQGWLPCPAS